MRTFQSFGGRLLPGVLAAFRRRCPGVEVRIEEALTSDALFGAVEAGEVDVSFAGYPLPEGPFAVRELFDDPYVLVTRKGDDVHGLGDLSGRRLLGIRGCQHTQAIEMQMIARGVAPETWARFDNNAIIQALVVSGEGVAIVPELVIDAGDPNLDCCRCPSSRPPPDRRVAPRADLERRRARVRRGRVGGVRGVIAVVTGAGSGIGRAARARARPTAGSSSLAGRREDALRETLPHDGLAVPTDVTDPASVDALFDAARERPRRPAVQQRRHRRAAAVPLEELHLRGLAARRRHEPDRRVPVRAGGVPRDEAQEPRGGRIINNGSISALRRRARTRSPTRRPSTRSPA